MVKPEVRTFNYLKIKSTIARFISPEILGIYLWTNDKKEKKKRVL